MTSVLGVFILYMCFSLYFVGFTDASHIDNNIKSSVTAQKTCTKVIRTSRKEAVTYQNTCYRAVKSCLILNIRCKYKTEGYPCNRIKYVQKFDERTEKVCCPGYLPLENTNDQCVRGCNIGLHGQDCSQTCTCPSTNTLPGCDIDSGECACQPGFTGKDCQTKCFNGRYGHQCGSICQCINGNKCDHVNGKCTCTNPGWTGEHCQKPCESNTYGINCASTCSCGNNTVDVCDRVTGVCKCKPGYVLPKCDKECPSGFYGDKCLKKCPCKNNNNCDRITGACFCTQRGYTGPLCDKRCSEGWYGVNCMTKCVCKNNTLCDPVTGACDCASGYLPPDCSQECPKGYFGESCSKTCTCNSGTCHHVTGNCICSTPGLTGNACNEVCSPGTFGIGCSQKCVCSPYQKCAPTTGECTCIAAGRLGKNCTEVCPQGRYGSGCKLTCTCSSPLHFCDPVSGDCTCTTVGLTGSNCETKCPSTRYGQNCENTCSCNINQRCDPHTGDCKCKSLTNQCPGCVCFAKGTANCRDICTPCSFTFQGTYCTEVPKSDKCRPKDTDTCTCKFGFYGPACDQACPSGLYGKNCTLKCSCNNCNAENGECPGQTTSDATPGITSTTVTDDITEEYQVETATAGSNVVKIIMWIAFCFAVLLGLFLIFIIIKCTRRRRVNRNLTKQINNRQENISVIDQDAISYNTVSSVIMHMNQQHSGDKMSVKRFKKKKTTPNVLNDASNNTDIYAIIAKEIDKTRRSPEVIRRRINNSPGRRSDNHSVDNEEITLHMESETRSDLPNDAEYDHLGKKPKSADPADRQRNDYDSIEHTDNRVNEKNDE